MTLDELSEWMAFDRSRDPDWVKAQEKKRERELSRQMDRDQLVLTAKKMLGDRS